MNLKLPAGEFRAYLFDCDGTIADSMPLHYKAWKSALAEYGGTYDEDLFYSWGGKPVRKIIADLNEMQGLNMPVDVLAARKETFYHAQLPELKGIPDVIEHIEAMHGRIPFAVVSGSRRQTVVGSLTALNLLDKSTFWFARKITLVASRLRKGFYLGLRNLEWRRNIASSLRTRNSAFKQRQRPVCNQF